mgnify:CR=1 FL=1
MASLTTSTIAALGGKLAVDIELSASNSNDNVTSATSGRIYVCQIDNTANSDAFYVKIRDAASPSTSTVNGTGTPHIVLQCPARKKVTYAIPGGHAYAAGVSVWGGTSTTVGDTSAATNPVIVKLVCS